MRRLIIFLIIIITLNIFANDDDLEVICKFYQNKAYKSTIVQCNKFIIKYSNSTHYDLVKNMLGESLYNTNEYIEAKNVFKTLLNTPYSENAYYYLCLINIELDKLDEVHEYVQYLKDESKEKILFNLANKKYSEKYNEIYSENTIICAVNAFSIKDININDSLSKTTSYETINGNDGKIKFKKFTSPIYPPEAEKNAWSGDVEVEFIVKDGKSTFVGISRKSGYPVLDRAAEKAAKNWAFYIEKNGKYINGHVFIIIAFDF